MQLLVHSFESLAAVDGPGLRFAVFLAGCPLRCAYCHNPDTWTQTAATPYTAEALCQKILRYRPYFGERGGVTFSGGEPLLQAKALLPLVRMLRESGVSVALDTAGSVYNADVQAVLDEAPLLLLDIKMPDEERYRQHIGGSLACALQVLEQAGKAGCAVWLRYVVVPGINDSDDDVRALTAIANAHPCVEKIELLPYHTMGVHKYEALGMAYPLEGVQPPTEAHMAHLRGLAETLFCAAST